MRSADYAALTKAIREQGGIKSVRGPLKKLAESAPEPDGRDDWATRTAVQLLGKFATGSGIMWCVSDLKGRGWSDAAIRDYLGEPDELRDNPKYRSAPPMRLYEDGRVKAVEATPAWQAWQAGAEERRNRPPKDHSPAFVRRYGDRAKAIPDAAEALWNLNRYAKHDSCTRPHQDAIYDLKNRFLVKLIGLGALTGQGQHEIVQPERVYHCYCLDRGGDDNCPKCEGTGIFRTLPARTLRFLVLRFQVGEKQFTWHQPEDRFDGTIPEGTPDLPADDDWKTEREKPIDLKSAAFAKAKALIRWVLEN